jgi:antitoxin VapB
MSVLSIKSAEASSLARQIARETGESLTAVVTGALRDRLGSVRRKRNRCDALDRIQQIARSRTVLDDRPHDEIVGYDEVGAPL